MPTPGGYFEFMEMNLKYIAAEIRRCVSRNRYFKDLPSKEISLQETKDILLKEADWLDKHFEINRLIDLFFSEEISEEEFLSRYENLKEKHQL